MRTSANETLSIEVRLATWGEVDRDAAVGAIPGTRMMSRREHRVRRCGSAVEILDEAANVSSYRRDRATPPSAERTGPACVEMNQARVKA